MGRVSLAIQRPLASTPSAGGNLQGGSRALTRHADLLHQSLAQSGPARADSQRSPGCRPAQREKRALEEVRRRISNAGARIALAAACALVLVIALALSVHRYRQPVAAPPEALAHIAEKNRDAAVVAAARQRADSAATTNAAETIAEARRRGEAEANATLARFPDVDNRTDSNVRH